jgi:hypothetical protein
MLVKYALYINYTYVTYNDEGISEKKWSWRNLRQVHHSPEGAVGNIKRAQSGDPVHRAGFKVASLFSLIII